MTRELGQSCWITEAARSFCIRAREDPMITRSMVSRLHHWVTCKRFCARNTSKPSAPRTGTYSRRPSSSLQTQSMFFATGPSSYWGLPDLLPLLLLDSEESAARETSEHDLSAVSSAGSGATAPLPLCQAIGKPRSPSV